MPQDLMKFLFSVTTWKRRAFFLLFDIIIIAFSLYASFWLRFDGQIPGQYLTQYPFYLIADISIKLLFLYIFGMYNFSWRFFSVLDLARLTAAIILSTGTLSSIFMIFRENAYIGGMPRSVLLIDFVLTFSLMSSLRISKRIYVEYISKRRKLEKGKLRLLIIGAGEAGNSILGEMIRNPKSAGVQNSSQFVLRSEPS